VIQNNRHNPSQITDTRKLPLLIYLNDSSFPDGLALLLYKAFNLNRVLPLAKVLLPGKSSAANSKRLNTGQRKRQWQDFGFD
jgi:hypothetical protein